MDQQSMGPPLPGHLLSHHNMAGQRLDHHLDGSHLLRLEEAGLSAPTPSLADCRHALGRALHLRVKKDDPETPSLERLCPPHRGRKGPYPRFGTATVVSLFSLRSRADRLCCRDLPFPPSAQVDPSLSLLDHGGGAFSDLHGG